MAQHAGLVDFVTQRIQFLLGGRRDVFDFLGDLDLEFGVRLDVVHGHAREQLRQPRLERVGVEVEDAFRRHDPLGAAAVEPVVAADLLARVRDEIVREMIRTGDVDDGDAGDAGMPICQPGLEEFCSVLPAGLGRSIYRFASKRGWQHRFNIGMHVRSTNITGFLLLRLLAGLRWWRPDTWRFGEEQARIQRWLGAIVPAAPQDPALAAEIVACGQIMKGYGDTHARAVRNFEVIADAYFGNLNAEPAAMIVAIRDARKAALTDPEGQSLAAEIAKSSFARKPQRVFAAAAE